MVNVPQQSLGDSVDPQKAGVNVVALVRSDGERFVFMCDGAESIGALAKKIDAFAHNPNLSLTPEEALMLKTKLYKLYEIPFSAPEIVTKKRGVRGLLRRLLSTMV